MVEEVEDQKNHEVGQTLPEGINALLVNKEEYEDTLQWRKELPSIFKKMAGTNPATKNRPKTEPLVNKPKAKPRFVEPDIHKCQPTSSKVKVENLVTREQEES
jgi:hypothetical protein